MIAGLTLNLFGILVLGCGFLFGILIVIALYPRAAFVMPKGYSGTKRKELLETNGLFKLFAPILHFFEYNNAKVKAPQMKANIEEKLMLAGNPMGMNADEFLGLCETSAIFFGAFAAFFMFMVFRNVSVFLVFALGIFGGFFPVIWLNGQGDRRTLLINRNLPYVLDLLVLSMEAGLDFVGSVERIVRGGAKGDPLREELDTALKEMKMGKTRREALEAISSRVRSENLNTIISSIIQGEILGTPLSKVLRIQSEMMRVRRSQNAEKLAGEAPVKMMFPLLLIFVSVFIILFGGTIVNAIRGRLF
jgi:tight adherence protein C